MVTTSSGGENEFLPLALLVVALLLVMVTIATWAGVGNLETKQSRLERRISTLEGAMATSASTPTDTAEPPTSTPLATEVAKLNRRVTHLETMAVAPTRPLFPKTGLEEDAEEERNGEWFISYYGTEEDGFLGEYHAAYWNGITCRTSEGALVPNIITNDSPCCAAPRSVPFCSVLLVTTTEGTAECVVVDRMKNDKIDGKLHLDLCPSFHESILKAGIDEHGQVKVKGIY